MKNFKFNKNKIWFWISLSYLIFVAVFFLITMILQINWFNKNELNIPIFLWIVSKEYVGVFFLPFLILSSFVAYFVFENSKPITVEYAIKINKILFEDDKIDFEQFKKVHETYTKKEKERINNEIKETDE